MLNSLATYYEAGHKTGTARTQHDEARAKFSADWFRRALALEPEPDKPAIREAYDNGYKTARGIK